MSSSRSRNPAASHGAHAMALARISASRTHAASAPNLISNAGEVRNRNKFWNPVYRSRHSSGSVTSKYASEVLIVSRVSLEADIHPELTISLIGNARSQDFPLSI